MKVLEAGYCSLFGKIAELFPLFSYPPVDMAFVKNQHVAKRLAMRYSPLGY